MTDYQEQLARRAADAIQAMKLTKETMLDFKRAAERLAEIWRESMNRWLRTEIGRVEARRLAFRDAWQ